MGRHDQDHASDDSVGEEGKRYKTVRKRKRHKSSSSRSKKRDDHKPRRKPKEERRRGRSPSSSLEGQESFASSSSTSGTHEHRRDGKRHKKEKKRRRSTSPAHSLENEEDYSVASSSSSSSDSCARRRDRKRRKKEKKHRKKLKRQERKRSKKRSDRHKGEERIKSSTKGGDDDDMESTNSLQQRLERNYQFANALQALFKIQPGMALELPILLIRMAEGTSFNLSQMPDGRVSTRLQQVLASLSPFGVERDDETASWSWSAPSSSGKNKDPLILLRVVRTLLDQIGITMEAVRTYEEKKEAEATTREATNVQEQFGARLKQKTDLLLQQFQRNERLSEAGPTLAQELATLCNMIMAGESISLDGLTNEALRDAIQNLFQAAGLEKSEMEDSDDDDDHDDDDSDNEGDEPVMGYCLPEDDAGQASTNIASVLEVCKAQAAEGPKRLVKGPMLPPTEFEATTHMIEEVDDEEGPAPMGSEMAKRRVRKGPTLPPEVVTAMADRRKREFAMATGMDIEQQAGDGQREQWMMEPGEHDLLQGIKTGNAIKSRMFENKKKRSSDKGTVGAPIDPSVKAEVDAIMELQREARGPSLVEQHRLKKAEEKAQAAAKDGKERWQWSRDKDLDAGRRVDKNALNMVMGGAADNLKDKFQGGLSSGFM